MSALPRPIACLAIAAVAAFASSAVGCNDVSSPVDSDPRSGANSEADRFDKGAPEGPLDRGDNNGNNGNDGNDGNDGNGKEAPGSPIDIPDITVSQGQPFDEVRARFETELRDRCGGEICLRIDIERTDPNFETCEFVTTRPDPGTTVKRWTRVALIGGSRPCESPDPQGTPSSEASPGSPVTPDPEASPPEPPTSEVEPSTGTGR